MKRLLLCAALFTVALAAGQARADWPGYGPNGRYGSDGCYPSSSCYQPHCSSPDYYPPCRPDCHRPDCYPSDCHRPDCYPPSRPDCYPSDCHRPERYPHDCHPDCWPSNRGCSPYCQHDDRGKRR